MKSIKTIYAKIVFLLIMFAAGAGCGLIIDMFLFVNSVSLPDVPTFIIPFSLVGLCFGLLELSR